VPIATGLPPPIGDFCFLSVLGRLRHSQNGPTFTRRPPPRKRRRVDMAAPSPDRRDAELADKKLEAAKSRRFQQFLHNDPAGCVREYARSKKDQPKSE
jgi:hypothetical protein